MSRQRLRKPALLGRPDANERLEVLSGGCSYRPQAPLKSGGEDSVDGRTEDKGPGVD